MSTRSRCERGAVAVEFALVVPILLILVFGMINFGFIFASQISLNSAARDAARAGVVQPLSGSGQTCAQIAAAARASAGTIGSPSSKVAVRVTGPTVVGTAVDCSLAAGSNAVTGSGSSTPCTGSSSVTAPQLVVVLTNSYGSPVPLVPPTTLTQTAIGKFQCEYS